MALTEISAALSVTSDAIQRLNDITNTAKRPDINNIVLGLQSQLIGLSSKILSIQSEYDTLTKIKNELEKKLTAAEEKNDEHARYKLTSLNGNFVYEYTGSDRAAHYLCATCYDTKIKSVLHKQKSSSGDWLECRQNVDHNIFPRKSTDW
jgi:hypothetical protein